MTGTVPPPSSIVMQPDDSNITAVSTAASAAAFSVFLGLFIGVPFSLVFRHLCNRDAIAVTSVAEPFFYICSIGNPSAVTSSHPRRRCWPRCWTSSARRLGYFIGLPHPRWMCFERSGAVQLALQRAVWTGQPNDADPCAFVVSMGHKLQFMADAKTETCQECGQTFAVRTPVGARCSVGCVAAKYGMPSEYARPNGATGDLCRSDI